jgi:hypothetical protein
LITSIFILIQFRCFYQCESSVLTIAASLSSKSPFNSPWDKREEARKVHVKYLKTTFNLSIECYSDHLAVVHAFNEWLSNYQSQGAEAGYQYARKYWLSHSALLEIKATREYYRNYLINAGFLERLHHNRNSRKSDYKREIVEKSGLGLDEDVSEEEEDELSDASVSDEEPSDPNESFSTSQQKLTSSPSTNNNTKSSANAVSGVEQQMISSMIDDLLTRCALCAGLFPNVIRAIRVHHETKEFITKFHQADQHLSLHPSSLLTSRLNSLIDENHQDSFFIFHLKVKTNQILFFSLFLC